LHEFDKQLAKMSMKLSEMVKLRKILVSCESSTPKSRPTPNYQPKGVVKSKPKDKTNGEDVQCFRCKGIGHMIKDCPSKPKVVHANFAFDHWDENYESGDDEDVPGMNNFLQCLMATSSTDKSESRVVDSDDEAQEPDWKWLYECLKSKSDGYVETMTTIRKEIEILNSICDDADKSLIISLKSEVETLKACVKEGVDDMIVFDNEFREIKTSWEKRVGGLQSELNDLNGVHKATLEELASTKKALEDSKEKLIALHPSTSKLDHMLSVQKSSNDHRGLGFVEKASSSTSPSSTTFVLASNPPSVNVESIGKKKIQEKSKEKLKEKPREIPRGQPKSRYEFRKIEHHSTKSKRVPTCWTCGVRGHTYHNCWDYDYWCDGMEYYVPRRSSFHDHGKKMYKKKARDVGVPKGVKKSDPKVKIEPMEFSKPKQVWVRKDVLSVLGALSKCDVNSILTMLKFMNSITISDVDKNLNAT